ncbi:LCP family glycopolymer transferase [Listeria ilorinensis]|uniref:LCP family glycopolymer transferase n=1 Tax=Listeria ilorinensis TaxID=2867439 RepID=UPI001EF3F15F|nr:LCP family protein [Listeria ilorinensis]
MNNLRTDKYKKKKKHRVLKIISAILLVIILVCAGLLGYAYWKTSATFDQIHKPVEGKQNTSVTLNGSTPFSVLLLGVDEREGDRGRSDTMIAATVNGTTNKIQMLSIPRDTQTEIVGHNSVDKINAAYAYGGVKMAEDTASNFLNDIPFNYYIKINMEGFKDLVDAVGGITVYNDKDGLELGDKTFNKGEITLDGDDALAYVRIRKTDVEGDFGRQKRQQQVISAIADKLMSTGLIWHFNDVLNAVGDNIETDFTMNDVTKIAKNYAGALGNVENLQVSGTGGKQSDGIWYYVVSDDERARLHDELAKNLGIN